MGYFNILRVAKKLHSNMSGVAKNRFKISRVDSSVNIYIPVCVFE